jgi:hypothetical protein
MGFLNIGTRIMMGSSLGVTGKKSELILAQCKAVGGDVQLAGTGGRDYINTKRFEAEGIKIVFQNFQQPHYPQLHGKFVCNLSVVDYLFCSGAKEWQKTGLKKKVLL